MGVKFTNNAVSKFAGSVDGSQTTFTITPGDGALFPTLASGDWFPLVAVKPNGQREIMRCTGRSNDTLTVARSQEGTAALTFNAGEIVELRVTAGALAAYKEELATELMPVGAIIMFDPSDPLPSGGTWRACDGTNGTPNLVNKFIVCAGSTFPAGTTGGAVTKATSAVPNHGHVASSNVANGHNHTGNTGAHALTVLELPPHTHSTTFGRGPLTGPSGALLTLPGFNDPATLSTSSTGAGNAHRHTIALDGAHDHVITVQANGGHDHTVNVTPPYYALIFLKKVA